LSQSSLTLDQIDDLLDKSKKIWTENKDSKREERKDLRKKKRNEWKEGRVERGRSSLHYICKKLL